MFHIKCKSQNGVVKSFFPISTPTATRASRGPAARRVRGPAQSPRPARRGAAKREAGTAGGRLGLAPGLSGRGKGAEAAGRASGDCAGGAPLWEAGPGSPAWSRGQGPGSWCWCCRPSGSRWGAAAAGRRPAGGRKSAGRARGAAALGEGTLSLTSGDDSESGLSAPRTLVLESQARRLQRVAEEAAAD